MKAHWINTGVSLSGFEWVGGETLHRDTGAFYEDTFREPNFKSIWWLEKSLNAAKIVARVKSPAGSTT